MFFFKDNPPTGVMYAYGAYQPIFEKMENTIPNFILHDGVPSSQEIEAFTSDLSHRVLILDDLYSKISQSPEMADLFTKGSHHRNHSVFFITQNIFCQGKCMRTISLNTNYITLFKNLRDASQISTLGRQLYPGQVKGFLECYEDATSLPYTYLTIDLSPHSDKKYRLRSHIFPGEDTVIYNITR